MSEVSRIGLDTSKSVFALHAMDEADQPVLRVKLRLAQVIPFFRKCARIVVAMEACGGSHHWARKLSELGHEVRLIPPQGACPRARMRVSLSSGILEVGRENPIAPPLV